jgi:PAS domain S-box-containing protein
MNEQSKQIRFHEYVNEIDSINFLNSNILNNIDAFVFIFDYEQIKPVWINDYFEKKMGYTQKDLKNATSNDFLSLFHPKSLRQFLQRMQHYEETENEAHKTIYQIKTKRKEWIHVLVCSKVHKRNPDGSIKYLLGYGVEIEETELHRHVKIMKELNKKCGHISLLNKLSNREMEMIHHIAKGLTDKEIAEKLKISIHTTKTHRKRIISKLGLKNTAALVKFAVENGIG